MFFYWALVVGDRGKRKKKKWGKKRGGVKG